MHLTKSTHLLVIVDADLRLLELAGWNAALEHDVDLTVRSVLHLGQAEVGRDQTGQPGGSPHVSAFASHCRISAGVMKCRRKVNRLTIGLVGIEHVRSDYLLLVDVSIPCKKDLRKMQGNSVM